MVSAKGFAVLFLCTVVSQITPQQDSPTKGINWKNARPGKLLHALDSLVLDYHHQPTINSPISNDTKNSKSFLPTPGTSIRISNNHIRKGEPKNIARFPRRTDDVDESTSPESTYDYDRAYDTFVRKYFEDAALSASASSEKHHDTSTQYSGEDQFRSAEVDEPQIEETKHSSKTNKGCKSMVKNNKMCRICVRNGETSESCSYNKESAPKKFAYEIENRYRQHRELSPETMEHRPKPHQQYPKKSTSVDEASPTCMRKTMRNKVCYHCENERSETTVQCYTDMESKGTPDNSGNRKNAEQRIYKRTVLYTYEKVPPTAAPATTTSAKSPTEII
uniref:Uncharacterized protein n=1 Tax=Stomoxys calcitrans TaxID=35570 RepID=A0A1I8PMQ1_STOCA